jgi:AcrR family transcriptional regulator
MKAGSRKAILSAALELFARRGYSGTTTDAISRQARVSKGLIYTHFKTKQEILLAILDEQMDRLIPDFALPQDNRPPREKFVDFISTYVEIIRSEPLLRRLSLQLNLDDAFSKLMKTKGKRYIEESFSRMRALLVQLGSTTPDLDCYLIGFCFDGIAANYTVAPELVPLDAIRDHLITTFLAQWEHD